MEDEDTRPYKCINCKDRFQTVEEAKTHFDSAHLLNNNVSNEEILKRKEFKKGKSKCMKYKNSFKCVIRRCSVCGAHFSQKLALKKHIAFDHEGKKPYKCSVCESNFLSNAELKIHVSAVHEKKKSYQCGSCATSFARRPHLLSHFEEVHEGKKPFPCHICHKSFSRPSNRNRHVEISIEKGKCPKDKVQKTVPIFNM